MARSKWLRKCWRWATRKDIWPRGWWRVARANCLIHHDEFGVRLKPSVDVHVLRKGSITIFIWWMRGYTTIELKRRAR